VYVDACIVLNAGILFSKFSDNQNKFIHKTKTGTRTNPQNKKQKKTNRYNNNSSSSSVSGNNNNNLKNLDWD
jgi:uncharacterized protein YxeA